MMNRDCLVLKLLALISFGVSLSANASPIPLVTDFSTKFDAFFAPTGNGYNWGHDWREENYQNWVTASGRVVTASVKARELAGKDFLIAVTVDPVELLGSGHRFALAAAGSDPEFGGNVYLAEVAPNTNRVRLLRGARELIAEQDLENVDLSDLEPFELELTNLLSPLGNLTFTVRKGDIEERFTVLDITPLQGAYFGLRNENGSGGARFEVHFDDLELRSPTSAAFASVAPELAAVGRVYSYEPDADGLISVLEVPDWLAWENGRLEGTPASADVGTHPVRLRSEGLAEAEAEQGFTITVLAESVRAPEVSVERGFYEAAFELEITSMTEEAMLSYTLDGSTPSLENGKASESAVKIAIEQTTILRVRAMKEGLAPSEVATHSYLFLNDIKRQQANGRAPTGWPARAVNGQVFDYGMDPQVTEGLADDGFKQAMTDIATISIVTDLENLVDPEIGIWVNAEDRGRDAERPVSVEMIGDALSPGFQIDAGARIRGGFSRRGVNPKHALHLYFRREYGEGRLRYPLFGEEGVDSFDRLDLRTTQGRSWHASATADATFNRDVFGRHLQRDMGQPYTRSRYYHLYLNGIYFGLFQSQERLDKTYAASYFGGAPGDYDVVKTRTRPHRVEVLDGDADAWTQLYDAAVKGFGADEDYLKAQGLVDVDNLIDYMLAIFFTGQSDGPVNLRANVPKNFFALRARDGSFGFRFFVHDNEDSLQDLNADATVDNDTGERLTQFNPKWLHQRLTENANYRSRFGDRAHRHLFNGGVLDAPTAIANFQRTADQLQHAIIGESARWGDASRANPYTQADWERAVAGKVDRWIPQRADILLTQLQRKGLYPDLSAPTFSQHGGKISEGFALRIHSGGTIFEPPREVFYTTDGSDPMEASAITYQTEIPIDEPATIKARSFSEGQWSTMTEATFFTGLPPDTSNLAISEIFYNPPGDSEDLEFIEIVNRSSTHSVHLGGLKFTDGIVFTFPSHLSLQANERGVLVRNRAAFEAQYGEDVLVLGEYKGALSNSGERLVLPGIANITFSDRLSWPDAADGAGRSLVYIDGDPSVPTNWRAGTVEGGSPGRADTPNDHDFRLHAFGGYKLRVIDGEVIGVPVNLAAEDIRYELQWSDDLVQWIPNDESRFTLHGETNLEGPYALRRFRDTMPGNTVYVRVKAWVE